MEPKPTETDPSSDVECVGCRQTGRRSDLERFVYHESVGLVYDMRGGAPGASMYVHPLPGCIRAASWAGFSRALGEPLRELEGDELVDRVATGLGKRLAEQIREAGRFDEFFAGRSAVEEAGDRRALELLLVDEQAGAEVRQLADRVASESGGLAVFETIPAELLSETIGSTVAIAGPAPGDRGEAIGRTAEKLICIEQDEG